MKLGRKCPTARAKKFIDLKTTGNKPKKAQLKEPTKIKRERSISVKLHTICEPHAGHPKWD